MKALVIGAGRMGGFHRRVLRDLGLDVTTVDPDPLVGADCLTAPGRRFDVVCVAVPIPHLAEQAARWAGHEGWLLIEKPGAATTGQATDLAALLAGQRVAVGYVERFNPQVRGLAERLADAAPPTSAYFRRWNVRPTTDIALDLQSHDLDLARLLGLDCHVTYDCAAGQQQVRREVTIRTSPWTLHADLTAHDTSPLHAQWHALLSDRGGWASISDAARTLANLSVLRGEQWRTLECWRPRACA